MQREYLAQVDSPCGKLLMHFEGVLAQRRGMEGDRLDPTLVVDRFIAARPGDSCPRVVAQASLMRSPFEPKEAERRIDWQPSPRPWRSVPRRSRRRRRQALSDDEKAALAALQNASGRWERAFLAERECRSHRASNRNGKLLCES